MKKKKSKRIISTCCSEPLRFDPVMCGGRELFLEQLKDRESDEMFEKRKAITRKEVKRLVKKLFINTGK